MSKGSQRRPTQISRELERLRWRYAMQEPPMKFAEYARRLKGLKKRGLV